MRFKKILLVSPRFYKGRHRLSIHPLAGLGYVAETLKKASVTVKVLDMNLQYGFKDLKDQISIFDPDLIGFSIMTFGYKEQFAMISKIKELFPDKDIVAGGPHISTLRAKALKDCPAIDYGIILEGDLSVVELCRGIELKHIQGLIFRKGDEIITNDFDNFITDLDEISFPRYEAFELDKYPTRQLGIVTSRGCPYSCIYCPVISAIGKQFRQRSAESVVEEIAYWYKNGYRDILVLDDNFTLSRDRVEKICDLLGRQDFKGLSLKCPNGIRADRVDYNLLKEMKRVGFDMIAFGVEAAEDRILKNIKKGEDIVTIEKSIRDACDLGFDVELFFLIGSPGERFEDIKSSFSLAMRYPITSAKFYNIIPFPTTELYDWIEKNNYFIRSPEEIMNNASHFINQPCFYTPEMSVLDRRRAFRMGQGVTRKIRRQFIERKIKAPLVIKRSFSWIYTQPFVERMSVNNPDFVRIKEALRYFIKQSNKTGKALQKQL